MPYASTASAEGGRALLALGSNLGNRPVQLGLALAALPELGLRALAATPRWNTSPLDCPPQRDFLNQLVLVEGRRDPSGWLLLIKALEERCGRVRSVPRGPRRLDADLILVQGSRWDDPRLTVPHPALLDRPYLLFGAALLVPEWEVGAGGETAGELARRRLRPPWAPTGPAGVTEEDGPPARESP